MDNCQGNGEHPDYEICCDNCNWYLACFPEAMPKKKTMYKLVFEYADGRKGVCIEKGKECVFDSEQEATDRAAYLNSRIHEYMKPFVPTYRVEKA